MSAPFIGITLDYQTQRTFSAYPWYALRANYAQAVAQGGGVPVMIPYAHEAVSHYVNRLDGLIVAGGRFDIDPARYGDKILHQQTTTNPERTVFEEALLSGFLEKDKPVLAICGGEQLLNVVRGGTLYQHLPDDRPRSLNHFQEDQRHRTCHDITLEEGGVLASLVEDKTWGVNSSHHQAVKDLGDGVRIEACAFDGIIEAISLPSQRFALGVQWHPEFLLTPLDQAIFQSFLKAARV
jgi:putative glutamine amidotransferase